MDVNRFSLAYHSIYQRNWRILGSVWVLCALASTVLQILVLIHPNWIGNDDGGYFGLYDFCATTDCPWHVFRVRPLSLPFEIAAFLVLSATVLSILAVFSIMLLVLLRDRYVFLLCSWMQLFSFFAMLAGCALYPLGWEHPRVKEVCDSSKYRPGECELRWPLIIAVVLVFDQLALAILGFTLACKQPPQLPELTSLYGPTMGSGFSTDGQRRNSLQESVYSKSRLHY